MAGARAGSWQRWALLPTAVAVFFAPQLAGGSRRDCIAARDPRIVEGKRQVHREALRQGHADRAGGGQLARPGGGGQLFDLQPVADEPPGQDHVG